MTEKGAALRGSFLRAVITPHTKGSWGPFRRKAQAHCPTQRGGLLASLPPSHSTFPLPALIGIQFHTRLQAPGSGFHQELRAGVLGEAQVEPSTFSLPEAWRGGPVGAPLKAPPLGSVSRDWVKGDRDAPHRSGQQPLIAQVPLYASSAATARRQAVQQKDPSVPSLPPDGAYLCTFPQPSQGGELGHNPSLGEPVLGQVRRQTRNHAGLYD